MPRLIFRLYFGQPGADQMARQYQTAIIIVIHDEKIIPTSRRLYRIGDGRTREEAGEGSAV